MDAYKTFPVVNTPPVRFIGGPINQGKTGNINEYWEPEISVYVITTVGVPVKEYLADFGMNYRKEMIHM